MFTQLIFIIILLLLTSFTRTNDDYLQWAAGLGAYVLLLGLIAYQNYAYKKSSSHRKEALNFLTSVELTAFIALSCIFIGVPKTFYFPSSSLVVYNFFLYFFGLFFFHYTYPKKFPAASSAANQIIILVPFILPLLVYTFINDLLLLAGYNLEAQSFVVIALFGFTFALVLLMLMPPVLLLFWRCKPLNDIAFVQPFQSVCAKANFRHGGFKVWTVLNHIPTAAIIGLISKFRYVMFTRTLLNRLSIEPLKAVLAHEIGHSKRRHLFKLPFVLLGMGVTATLILSFFEEGTVVFFNHLAKVFPFHYWREMEIVFLFVLTAITAALYIRYVFGYFSRLFEKEADLYGIEIGLPASSMIDALEGIAVATGNSHETPSWHHDSIANRIRFIQKAEANPLLIGEHKRRARRSLIIYGVCLLSGILFLTAPYYPEIQLFKTLNALGLSIEKGLTSMISSLFP
ncbi:MAG: M48 family metallopeptidase [Parachlamydiales bacterium]|jgi:STE24 endopeptidase